MVTSYQPICPVLALQTRYKSSLAPQGVGFLVRHQDDVLQKIREHFWRVIRTL